MKTAQKPTPQEKTSLQVTKWIKASPERVFQAWAKPEQMARWFKADHMQVAPVIEASFVIGGRYSITIPRDENKQLIHGKYLEIVTNKKIIFTWVWDGNAGCGQVKDETPVSVDSVVTVEFAGKNGGTEVTLTHDHLPDEHQVNRHSEGWNGCLDRMQKLVEA